MLNSITRQVKNVSLVMAKRDVCIFVYSITEKSVLFDCLPSDICISVYIIFEKKKKAIKLDVSEIALCFLNLFNGTYCVHLLISILM